MHWKVTLAALLVSLALPGFGEDLKPPNEPDAQDMWEQEIHRKLSQRVTFQFIDTPLAEAIHFLSDLAKATIILDPKVVAEGADKAPITLKVTDMELELALKWVLRLAELEYDFRGQAVFITRKANLASNIKLEIYDIRDLISGNTDFPAPHYWLSGQQEQIVNPFGNAAALAPGWQGADLVTLIHDKLLPAEFADPGTSIEENNGKLVVMQRPPVQKFIGKFLSRFRELYKPQMLIKGCVAAVAEIPEDTYFDEGGLAKILLAGTVVAAPRLVCFNQQRVHMLDGKLIGFISTIQVSDVAGTAEIPGPDTRNGAKQVSECYEPVTSTALDGIVLDVRPTLSPDRTSIELDLRFDSRLNIAKRSQSIGVADEKGEASVIPLATKEEPKSEAGKGKKDEEKTHTKQAGGLLSGQYVVGASIDLLAADTNYMQTQVVAPAGKWVLAAVFNNRDPKIPQKYLLLFVTAEALGKKITDKDMSWVPMGQSRVQPPVPRPAPAVAPPAPPRKTDVNEDF